MQIFLIGEGVREEQISPPQVEMYQQNHSITRARPPG